jgi:quercetin dioxygenase-like cupin family protein
MQITRNGLETTVGPGNWFAGHVYIDVVSTPSPPSRVMGGVVHFTPGARTAWHHVGASRHRGGVFGLGPPVARRHASVIA